MTDSNNEFDQVINDDNCHNLDQIAKVFEILTIQGYKQVIVSFSGGGDDGAFDYALGIKAEFYNNKNLDTSDLSIIGNELKNNAVEFSTGSLYDFMISAGINEFENFEHFLYDRCLVNISFDGDCYSHGIIFIDLISKTVITKAEQEVKTWQPIDLMTTKLDSLYFSSYTENNSKFNEL